MRSGLQKQRRLRKGRACQAVFLWCFSMTSLGSVSHLLKPRRDVRESHKQWILMKCMHFTMSCWKIPTCQGSGTCPQTCKHPAADVSLPYATYNQLLPESCSISSVWVLTMSVQHQRIWCSEVDLTKGNKQSFWLSVDSLFWILLILSHCTEVFLVQEHPRMTVPRTVTSPCNDTSLAQLCVCGLFLSVKKNENKQTKPIPTKHTHNKT